MNGEPSFGVTVHLMDEKLDNGDVVVREPCCSGVDTLVTLYPQAFAAASALLAGPSTRMTDR
jgi:methionyl-tRNA formyltransferase